MEYVLVPVSYIDQLREKLNELTKSESRINLTKDELMIYNYIQKLGGACYYRDLRVGLSINKDPAYVAFRLTKKGLLSKDPGKKPTKLRINTSIHSKGQ